MSFNDQQQAELLDQYTAALRHDPRALPPGDLTPDLVTLARQLHHRTTSAEPSPGFAAQLRQQIDARALHLSHQQAATPRRRSFPSFSGMRWWSLGGMAALVTVVALVAAQFLTLQARPVSAAEILQKAQTAARDTTIRSFALTETLQSVGAPGQSDGGFVNTTRRWYEAPNRWRIESTYTMPGQRGTTQSAMQVSDGTTRWDYDPQQNTVTIDRVEAGQDGQNGLNAFGVTGLEAVLAEAGKCRAATLRPDAKIAARAAYVVELGESTCGSNAAPELNGRQVVWIDQATFFVLKAELYGSNGERIATREITSLEYNPTVEAQQFSFEPPADATVQDLRK